MSISLAVKEVDPTVGDRSLLSDRNLDSGVEVTDFQGRTCIVS